MNSKEIVEEGLIVLEAVTQCNWPHNKRVTREKIIEALSQYKVPAYKYLDYKNGDGISNVFRRSVTDYVLLKGSIKTHRNFILSLTDIFFCLNCEEYLHIENKVSTQYICKSCQADYEKEKRKKSNIYIYNHLLKNPCKDCGEADPIVLEFDHTNPKEKEYNISSMHGMYIDKIKKEIDKCDVVCANCHKRRTAKQQNWYKYKINNSV